MIRPHSVGLLLVVLSSPLGAIDRLDHDVQSWVQERRTPSLDRVARASTGIGRPAVVFGGLLAVAVFTGPAGPATARAALGASVATNIVVELLKRAVGRERPDGERRSSNSGFPSSHAANAAALAAVLAARWRRAAVLYWIPALMVAGSRVVLNRHFLTDALFGVAIGVGCAWLVLRYASWWVRPPASTPAPEPRIATSGDAARTL
jgi:membrane-associated phospholipid phosphatase